MDRWADDPATFGGASTSETPDCRAEEGEGQQASQPVHSTDVRLVSFLSVIFEYTFEFLNVHLSIT